MQFLERFYKKTFIKGLYKLRKEKSELCKEMRCAENRAEDMVKTWNLGFCRKVCHKEM